jgi:hypothetical protein
MRVAPCLALLALAGGCGYRLETARLPAGAATVYLGLVENRTQTGELDVRLRDKLRATVLRHSAAALAPLEQADLILDVALTGLNITRARDLASTNLQSVVIDLTGNITLVDRRTGRAQYRNTPLAVQARQDFDTPVVETPAIRADGINDVLDAFVAGVEKMLFRGF